MFAVEARARGQESSPASPHYAATAQRLAAPEERADHQPAGLVRSVTSSSGTPLDDPVRQRMERAFSADFSSVRIHTDRTAEASARALGARAYTVGDHVAFGRGAYAPNTPAGHKALAHELAHVVQQRSGVVAGRVRADGLRVSDPTNVDERAAEATAHRVADGEPAHSQSAAAVSGYDADPQVQRACCSSCQSGGECEDTEAPSVQRIPDDVASDASPQTADADATPASAGPSASHSPVWGSAAAVSEDVARDAIEYARRKFGPISTGFAPYPEDESVAANSPDAVESTPNPATSAGAEPDVAVQALVESAIQRSGGRGFTDVSGGVVGSVQVCFDMCTGEAYVTGWVWFGAGATLWGHWVGPYAYYEGELMSRRRVINSHVPCGTCDPACRHESGGWGGGIAWFPVHLEPGERARFSRGGLEAGLLFSPHSFCDADIELILLLNMLGYLGPVGRGIQTFLEGFRGFAERYEFPYPTFEFGIDGSTSVHVCKSATGGPTVDHWNFCLGGFIGGGIGVSRTRVPAH